MKLEDVQRMATPGTWRSYHPAYHADPNSRAITTGEDDKGFHVATWIKKEDAALLAHWYNHGPKLLKALKQTVVLADNNGRITKDSILADQLRTLVNYASEVEGI